MPCGVQEQSLVEELEPLGFHMGGAAWFFGRARLMREVGFHTVHYVQYCFIFGPGVV